MQITNIASFQCSRCKSVFKPIPVPTVCEKCAGTLYMRYDFSAQRGLSERDSLGENKDDRRWSGMWRYRNILPVVEPVTLGEGWTPMLRCVTGPSMKAFCFRRKERHRLPHTTTSLKLGFSESRTGSFYSIPVPVTSTRMYLLGIYRVSTQCLVPSEHPPSDQLRMNAWTCLSSMRNVNATRTDAWFATATA
jgi:hypothetical protein